MVPFGLTEEQFCTRYRRGLDRISEQTISVVRALIARPANVGVQYADIEVFVDEHGGAPSVWVYYLGENNKVDRNDQSIFPGRSLDLQLPLNRLADFDERYFLGEEFRGLFLAANVLKACSQSAGGRPAAGPIQWPRG